VLLHAVRIASTPCAFIWLGITLVIGYLPRVSPRTWLWLGIVLIIGYLPHVLHILLVRISSWASRIISCSPCITAVFVAFH
jgi:hypothetical protein